MYSDARTHAQRVSFPRRGLNTRLAINAHNERILPPRPSPGQERRAAQRSTLGFRRFRFGRNSKEFLTFFLGLYAFLG